MRASRFLWVLIAIAAVVAIFAIPRRKAPQRSPEARRPELPAAPEDRVEPGPAKLEGVVLDARRRVPLPGIGLHLKGPQASRSTRSDAQGRFAFDNLPSSPWTIHADPHGCGWRSPEISVNPRAGTLTLEISGLRRVSGRVLAADAVAPSEIRLEADFLDGSDRSRALLHDPAFELLVDPSHADLELRAEAPGCAAAEPLRVRLPPNEDVSGLELRLRKGVALAGIVLEESGAPAVDARVEARRDDGRSRPLSVLSDASGRFVLPALAEGVYALEASKAGWAPATLDGVSAPGAHVELRLRKGWTLRGRLEDVAGRPIAKARVTLQEGARRMSTTSGGDGRFEFEGIAPAGAPDNRHPNIDLLRGAAPGYGATTLLDIPPSSEVRLTLAAAGALLLRVRGLEGPLDPDLAWTARLAMRQSKHPEDRSAELGWTATQGRGAAARIENLTPGLYELEVSAPGRSTFRLAGIAVDSGREGALDVILLPGQSDTPILEFDASGPEEIKAKLPRLLAGFNDAAREDLINVLRGLYPPDSPERAALEEVVKALKGGK